VCDIPDRVGPVARTYPGRIDWPGGSEAFQFRLSKETLVVCLQSVVAVNDFVRVFFVVDEDPPFTTKFKRGEWFYRQRVCFDNNAPVPNTLSIRLSRFRNADDFVRTRRPRID
jgi:hypothetical protein